MLLQLLFGTVHIKKLFSLFIGHSLGHIFFVQKFDRNFWCVVSLNFLNLNRIIGDFNIRRRLQNKLEISVKIFRLSDGLFGR